MHNHINISDDFRIKRFNNGIKLLLPDDNHRYPTVKEAMSMPFPVYFGDWDQNAVFINEKTAEVCGFNSVRESIGVAWHRSFKKKTVLHSIKNHHEVMDENRYKIAEESVKRNDNVSINILSFRMPWYNETNKIIGLFGCSAMLGQNSLEKSLALMQQIGALNSITEHYSSSNRIGTHHLSRRELECLKLAVRGKSAKQSADFLRLSQRTVEEYLNNVKFKFGVSSKSELIDVAIDYFREI